MKALFLFFALQTNAHALDVQGSVITAGSITTTKLGSGSITTDKIGADAVISSAILTSAITTNKIASGAATTDKIAKDAVTGAAIRTDALSAGSGITITRSGNNLSIAASAAVAVSSYGVVNGTGVYTTTQANLLQCVSGSSRTVTTNGNACTIEFNGGWYHTNTSIGNVLFKMGYLMDGDFYDGHTATRGVWDIQINATGLVWPYMPSPWSVTTITPPSAASHTFCLTIANDSARTEGLSTDYGFPIFGVTCY